MNLLALALKLPTIIIGMMQVVQQVKGLAGTDKKAAVLAAVPESIHLAEFAAGKDIVNDATVQSLIGAVIDAEAAAMKAREALKAGILAKAA